MARPWYSFYPADYGRDTGHLTLVEHGAYRVLMDHYYSHEAPLPPKLARLFRLCRAKTEDEKKAVRFVLKEFFERRDDGFRHKRIEAEIAKAEEKSVRGAVAGRASAVQRAVNRKATPEQPSQSPSQAPSQDSSFDDFWAAYPRKEARGAAVKAWGRALELAAAQTLVAAAKSYAAKRDGQDRRFTRLPATWLAQECWLDDTPVVADADGAARAWDGHAAKLVAQIGAAPFQAYFAGCGFSPGPPAVIRVAGAHLRGLIAKRFSGALARAFGEFSLEA